MKNEYTTFLQLLTVQDGLNTLKPIMDKNDDMSCTLSDIWNLLLDSRSHCLSLLLKSEKMNAHGLKDDLLQQLKISP